MQKDILAAMEEAKRRYIQSDKGKETQKKWNESEAKKKSQEAYFKSEKGMTARLRYYLSEKGMNSRQRRNELQKLLRRCYKFTIANPDKTIEDFLDSLRGENKEV